MPKSGSRANKPTTTAGATAARKSRKATPADAGPTETAAAPLPTAAAVELAADLRIGAAAATHAEILAAAALGEVILDGGRVAKIDAAGVQALLAAVIQISHSGGRWRWHNPSVTLAQGVTVLGLGESLRLP